MTEQPTALCLLHTPESVDTLVTATARLGTAMGWAQILFVAIEEIPRHTPLEEFRRTDNPVQVRQQQLLQHALDCAKPWEIPCQSEGFITHNATYTLQQFFQKKRASWIIGAFCTPTSWAMESSRVKIKSLREIHPFTGIQIQPGYHLGDSVGCLLTPDTLNARITECAASLGRETTTASYSLVYLSDDTVPDPFSPEEYAGIVIEKLTRTTDQPSNITVLPQSVSAGDLLTTLNQFDTLVMGSPHPTRLLGRFVHDDIATVVEQLASTLLLVHPSTAH